MGVPKERIFKYNNKFTNASNNKNERIFGLLELETNSSISSFYGNKNILITGATGFLGKALVEKLLRSCGNVDAIFVLIRPKKGIPVEERVKELLKNPVFDKLREKNPDIFEKLKAIPGDVGLPELGLSVENKTFLIENIDIVFHSAATVRFNENLKTAVTLNTLGTKRLLEMCKEMKHLKCFVHVSTAFSNSDKKEIEEKVYEVPYDPRAIINVVETLPDDMLQSITSKLIGKHPNTYTFAKALAEQLVLEYSKEMPAVIVRPSIITPAWKEPYPGWVDNFTGITGIMMECGRGTIKSIICDENCHMELIPVDIVVNTLITGPWHKTSVYGERGLKVYNCTVGPLNPVTWKEFGRFTLKHSRKWPSKYVTWYPGFTYRTNRIMHFVCTLLYHNIPSMFLDAVLYCTGKKPMMLKISRKFNQALEAGSFFSTNEWDFDCGRFQSLLRAVNCADDGEEFSVDVTTGSGFNWDDYVCDFLKGVNRFILNDDMSVVSKSLTKLNRLYWGQKLFQGLLLCAAYRTAAGYF